MSDRIDNIVSNIKLTEKTIDHLNYTFEDYLSFLESFYKLDKNMMNIFLKTLKKREIVNNQETELEESFLMEMYNIYQRKDSIDVVMKVLEDGIVTKDELKKLHRIVIKNSSDDCSQNYNYRTDNDKWVGSFDVSGNKRIDYMPPDYSKIDSLITQTLDYLNNEIGDTNLDHLFIKPFVVHALLAYIQPFGNGNTRLSRVLQHGKIWQMTKEQTDYKLELPAIYLSKNYLQTRNQYRTLIKDIAINNNSEVWNKWLDYNLNMIDEQLYYHGNNIKKLKR